MQNLLLDADNYLKAGHKDVAKALLHELVKEAERNTDRISEELYGPRYIQQIGRSVRPMPADTIAEVEFEAPDQPNAKNLVDWPRQAENRFYREPAQEFGQRLHSAVLDGSGAEATAEQSQSFTSFMNDQHKIQQGECVSDRGIDHCGYCVDHCEASDYRKTENLVTAPYRYIVQPHCTGWQVFDNKTNLVVLPSFLALVDAEKSCAELNEKYVNSLTPSINE